MPDVAVRKEGERVAVDAMIMSETRTCRGTNSHTFAVMGGVGKALDLPAIIIGSVRKCLLL